jgi:dTDP-4-amino-4,6-dideoxygalactose transaminase
MSVKRQRPHPTLRFRQLRPSHPARRFSALAQGLSLIDCYNGRAALFQLFRNLRASDRTDVLVPAFHCPTVVDPILVAGCDVKYYEIDTNLQIPRASLLDQLSPRVLAIVLINYFGAEEEVGDVIEECRRLGIYVVEDCSHSFLRHSPTGITGSRGDFAVFSYWKLLPSAVGGGIRLNAALPSASYEPAQTSLAGSVAIARTLLGDALDASPVGGLKRLLRGSPPVAEPAPVVRPPASVAYPFDQRLAMTGMPGPAKWVIRSADLEHVAATRRRNFSVLAEAIRDNASLRKVQPNLATNQVPWGFPILLSNRSRNDYRLHAAGVPLFTFGEVLHETIDAQHAASRSAREAAKHLADNLLVLSVHQGLSEEHLAHVAGIANAFDWIP